MRKRKRTYKEIAESLGMTKQRVHQIYKNHKPTPQSLVIEIRIRDGEQCRICHSKRKLEVHHVNGVKKDNSKTNLVTLCRKCHIRVEKNDRKTIKGTEPKYYNGEQIQARKRAKRKPAVDNST